MVAISYPKICLRNWGLFHLIFLLLAATLLSSCYGVRAELKKRGVSVDQEQLVEYAAAGDSEVVDLLLQADVPIEGRNSYGMSALMASSEAGEIDVVELLLERGADPNRSAKGSWETPLMLATIQGRTQVVRLLIEAGANVDNQDERTGVTLLMNAAVEGHSEIAADLLAAGVDVMVADQIGWTALHHAVRKGHSRLALELVAAGADPEQQDIDGFTALALAKSRGNWRLVSHLEKLQDDRRRGRRTASAADSPFAAPSGWEVVDPFADGIERIESVIRHSRLLDAIGAEQHS